MADNRKVIDVIFNQKSAGAGAAKTVDALKRVEEQANKTREKMEKLAQVGSKMALLGGAIVAPFALAMKKYVDTAKETEPLSKRLVELNKNWEESQVRLGRVTANIILPALEKGAEVLENIIAFAEKNPDLVKAALTVGTVLVGAGAIVAFAAQVVSFIATVQGLAAGFGLAGAGGAAAAGAGGAITAASLGTIIMGAITAALPFILAALALVVVAPLTLSFFNALAGTNQTMENLWETAKMLPTVIKYAASELGRWIGDALVNGLTKMGEWISNAIASITNWFQGDKAGGGYVTAGAYRVGEKGREFVLNASSTRAAENAIGSRLTQGNAMRMMTTNVQIGNGVTIAQARRMIRDNQSGMMSALAGAFGGA